MKKMMIALALTAVIVTTLNADAPDKAKKIQIAILLDTSNSMDGLIDQAKAQLWSIVNELSKARYDGIEPDIELALYEYGNDNLPGSEGHIRQLSQLTTDLDYISEILFGLKTYGGNEYCGHVIEVANRQLNWSTNPDDLKMIFIAGNEPFTQGAISYAKACDAAHERGIIVSTIFCGDYEEGINTKWKHGAQVGGGKYMNINHNLKTVYVETPYDDTILNLNEQLNETYISYGNEGKKLKTRQEAQDDNAGSFNKGSYVKRAVSKSSKQYKNAHWDLVDAVKEDKVKVESLEEEDLPQELQGKSTAEIKKIIKEKEKQRALIQQEISELNQKREKYVSQQKKNNAEDQSLDDALLNSVREIATKKNYEFKKK